MNCDNLTIRMTLQEKTNKTNESVNQKEDRKTDEIHLHYRPKKNTQCLTTKCPKVDSKIKEEGNTR